MTTSIRRDGYGAAIVSALEIESPRDSVTAVKGVVIQELQELDRGMEVKSTEYFNHTYVPDLVLRWNRDSGHERYVYLRFTENVDRLADGIGKIEDRQPIVFGLTPTLGDNTSLQDLDVAATDSDTLVTDPNAIETLISRKAQDPVLSLVSNAIAQGGRGLLGNDQTLNLAETVSQGFTGAKELSAEDTGRATELARKILDTKQAGRLTRFLQAVWVGSGGRSDLFPGQPELSGDLSNEALEFLLNFEEISDLDFWKRLGRRVTVPQLASLRLFESSRNLQHLIKANLTALWARACIVVPDQHLDVPDERFEWMIRDGRLALRGEDFTAYVAEQVEDVRQLQGATGRGISVDTLRRRAQGIVLDSLRLVDDHDSLSFESDDVVSDKRLPDLASRFSLRALVEKAQAVLPSRQHLSLDFREHTATGITRSRPPLAELLNVAVPVLHDLTDEHRRILDALLTVPNEEDRAEQLELFE